MGDMASPENLGKAAYLAYRHRVHGDSMQTALSHWYNDGDNEHKQQWLQVYEDIIEYHKAALSDS
jgi:hypothetical protein